MSAAEAILHDSVVESGEGGLSVTAQNESSIDALNTAATESSGVAVGVVLAFNSIGWKATNLLYGVIDTFLGTDAIGGEQPASVSASIEGSEISISGDLTLTAVSVPQIEATVINTVASSGAAAVGFVLASNLSSSTAEVVFRPAEDSTVTVGGSLESRASDTAGISARIGGSASSSGGASVGS